MKKERIASDESFELLKKRLADLIALKPETKTDPEPEPRAKRPKQDYMPFDEVDP